MTPRQLELHAMVDFCYYSIEQSNEVLNKAQSPLEVMIDDATGFKRAMHKNILFFLKEISKYKRELQTIEPNNPMYDTSIADRSITELEKLLNETI